MVVPDEPDVVFVSDRHVSIEKAMTANFDHASHGICIWHLFQNVKAKYHRGDLEEVFYKAAKAYTVEGFYRYFCMIEETSAPVAGYLRDSGFTKWARSHFPCNRYNITTTNNAESINSVVRCARKWPLRGLCDTIVEKLGGWFHTRRLNAANRAELVSEYVTTEMYVRWETSLYLTVRPLSEVEFHVGTGPAAVVVHLDTRKCDCREFDVDRFPCCHAIAACNWRGMDPGTLVDKKYSKQALADVYKESLYPVPPEARWTVPEDVASIVCLPPAVRRPVGRPVTKRKPSRGERSWFLSKTRANRGGGVKR